MVCTDVLGNCDFGESYDGQINLWSKSREVAPNHECTDRLVVGEGLVSLFFIMKKLRVILYDGQIRQGVIAFGIQNFVCAPRWQDPFTGVGPGLPPVYKRNTNTFCEPTPSNDWTTY